MAHHPARLRRLIGHVRWLALSLLLILPYAMADAQETTPTPTPRFPFLAQTQAAIQTAAPTPTPTATSAPVFPIRPGTIEGSINDAVTSVLYSFEATAGQSVTIRMETTSGGLDPFLSLYDSGGTLIARNDDLEPGNRNSLIALTLSQTGTYTIDASRFGQAGGVGTFRLSLTLTGTDAQPTPGDPLSAPPPFAVDFTIIQFQDVTAGLITADVPLRYFAVAGRQGDLMRAIMTRIEGDLSPQLRILNSQNTPISRESQTRAGETVAFVTLPETGWYLIEASAREGTGSFDIYTSRVAGTTLQVGDAVSGTFTAESPTTSYIVNARLGDLLSFNMFVGEDAQANGAGPELTLLDLSLREIGTATGQRFATLRTTAPRSSPYILQVSNRNPGTTGSFSLRFTNVPQEFAQIPAQDVTYNADYSGTITSNAPLQFYRFSGKVGELVTLSMTAPPGSGLDPYLILMDSDLNELTANDDAGAARDARITQFRLPKDGEYLIVASRSNLAQGVTAGTYTLAITAGEIALTPGLLTVTLDWRGSADLNLFVRDPRGRTVSWSSPRSPSGGVLQVDSNTLCQTLSAEPIEHIYFEGASLVPGDYDIWVWNQNACGVDVPVEFALTVNAGGETIVDATGVLTFGQRYATAVRVTETGEGGRMNDGEVTTPSPQQQASEGGDILIRYGTPVTGTITNERYAIFYQFTGEAGDAIVIRAERLTGNLDPIVILRDAADITLPDGINDDADDTTRDSLLTYVLPEDGTYIIAVTRFGVRDGTTTGDFRLTVERLE